MKINEQDFKNGDHGYIDTLFVGVWVGINPETFHDVVYNGDEKEYKAYRPYQIQKHPSLR